MGNKREEREKSEQNEWEKVCEGIYTLLGFGV